MRDGRQIGLAEFGAADGRPVVYCHGFPASRLEARFAHEAAQRIGARIVALDRPGCGLSDFAPGRRIADWAGDVAQVADALELERFAVLGVSGGAPYALACATGLPARVRALGLVGGLGALCAEDLAEFDLFARSVFALAAYAPIAARALVGLIGSILKRRPEWVFPLLAGELPEPDRAVLEDEHQRGVLLDALRESLAQGTRGAAWDLILYARNRKPFAEPIAAPTYVWHGERDTTVPIAMSRRFAASVSCVASFSSDHGHYSLPILEIEEILRPLIEA